MTDRGAYDNGGRPSASPCHRLKDAEMEKNMELGTEEKMSKIQWKDIGYQIFASNVAFFFTIHAGVNLAFSNLLLNDFDKQTGSWLASIAALATPLGGLLCGPLMDRIGRKGTCIAIYIPCVTNWILISIAKSDQIKLIYLARFFSGIASGLASSNLVLVSEISYKEYRPLLLSLLSVYFSFGILLTTILEVVFTWRASAAFFAFFFTVVVLLVTFFIPESPIWLARFRSDFEAAKRSLKKLNPNEQIFRHEWRQLMENVRSKEATNNEIGTGTQPSASASTSTSTSTYKPLLLLAILFLLQQLSGLYPLMFYAIKVFPAVSQSMGEVLKKEAFVTFGVVRFVASVIGSLLSIRVGRKSLLVYSSLGMLLTSVLLIMCKLTDAGQQSDFRDCISATMFILFIGLGTFGVMNVPWTLIVELLPVQARGIGGTFIISYTYLILFFTVKIFPFAMDAFGITALFGLFAVISFSLIVYTIFCIPETFGKTLHEIELYFKK